jgi:hypothetical protein
VTPKVNGSKEISMSCIWYWRRDACLEDGWELEVLLSRLDLFLFLRRDDLV